MRIIAKEQDYYDCVQAHGQDRTLVYIRQPEEEEIERGKWPFPSMYAWFSNHGIDQYIIGFCGKIYPMLELSTFGAKSQKCFNIDDVNAFVNKNMKAKQKRLYRGQRQRWWHGIGNRRIDFLKFFEECREKQDSYAKLFADKRCPVFVARYSQWVSGSTITYNSMLRPYDFVRMFDPYSAFQEISMFMGAMAMPEKEMPIISDELKAHSRGFNKWSFRRPPGGQ